MHSSRAFAVFFVSAALGAIAGCSGSPSTPPASSTPSAASPAPAAAAKPAPGSPLLYVSDETGTGVVVVDPIGKAVVQRINVGKRPRGLKISPDGTKLLVALSGSPIGGPGVDESKLPPADRAADGIGVVDLATHAVIRKYHSGSDPESFAMSLDGKMIFVSNEDSGEMTALDLESGDIKARVKVGEEPEGVTTGPDGKVVFVSCEGSNEVVAIDTRTFKVVGRVATGPRPRSIAFSRDGAIGFVASENAGTLTAFDARTRKVKKTIALPRPSEQGAIPPRPMGLQVSPDGSRLYVSLGRAKGIAVIDIATQEYKSTIADVGTRPWGIGISTDGTKLYTANGPSGDISIVDVATGKTEARVATGGSPWGIAVGQAR
jgi:YVTN family beta-propeller protein